MRSPIPATSRSRRILLPLSLLVNIGVILSLSIPHHAAPPTTVAEAWGIIRQAPETFASRLFYDSPGEHEQPFDAVALSSHNDLGRCGMCEVALELCAEVGRDKLAKAISYSGTWSFSRSVMAENIRL